MGVRLNQQRGGGELNFLGVSGKLGSLRLCCFDVGCVLVQAVLGVGQIVRGKRIVGEIVAFLFLLAGVVSSGFKRHFLIGGATQSLAQIRNRVCIDQSLVPCSGKGNVGHAVVE